MVYNSDSAKAKRLRYKEAMEFRDSPNQKNTVMLPPEFVQF